MHRSDAVRRAMSLLPETVYPCFTGRYCQLSSFVSARHVVASAAKWYPFAFNAPLSSVEASHGDERDRMTIAKLERVPLRDVWPHEANDFTQWLEQNVDVLSDALGRDIANVEREKKTESAFSVDLVAEGSDGSAIIIENQLGKSDHDHLGKLITYRAALQAGIAVWIVADPRPEHVAALNWLNESSSADFYLLKIEAIRIDNSPPAPLLTVIVGPSEEGKSIGESKREMNERDRMRHRWWSQLVQHPDATHHRHISPGNWSWLGASSGIRGLNYNYAVTKKTARVELYIDRGRGLSEENLHIFDQLHANLEPIENAFGGSLDWLRREGQQACMIRAELRGGYGAPEVEWRETHDRMTDAMKRLIGAVGPRLKSLDADNAVPFAAVPADANGT